MKRFLWILVLLINNQSIAQTFHALLIADTKDEMLAKACQRDVEVMHRQLTQAAAAIHFTLKETTLSGEQFTLNRLTTMLDSLSIQSTDIVFLYYTGHGYNIQGRTDRFPYLLMDKQQLGQNPALVSIHEQLKKKKARLCVTLGDCCNNLITNTRGMVGRKPMIRGLVLTNDSLNAAYKKLFLDVSGDVIIASSRPPQPSCAHPDSGSFYTRCFDEALELASQYNKTISWESLLKDTQTRLVRHSATRDKQSIYEINLNSKIVSEIPPATGFAQINEYLNALADEQRPEAERYVLLKKAKDYFDDRARIDIYVNTTLGEVQPIEQVIERLLLNAKKIQRINLLERLSILSSDGVHYQRAAIQEIW
ncbi:MAG: caspase family protein [Siphonobacter sp.]